MILLQLLTVAYGLLLPGVLAVFLLGAAWTLPVRIAVGAVLGALTVPMLCFCAAWLAGTSVTTALVLLVATGLNMALGALLVGRRLRASRREGRE